MKSRFDYGNYLDSVQDGEKLKQNLSAFVPFFSNCRRVLDLGCGSGHFLRLLSEAGIEGIGVDADPLMAEQAEASGLKVVLSDVLDFLHGSNERFDGIFCSHLVEHLPFETLVDLIEGIAQRLRPGGTLVMAFPNPESLDMQLFHFWLDPQHVRFYHPTLIEAMLRHYDFQVEPFRFRNWRTGGIWMNGNGISNSNGTSPKRGLTRKLGKSVKGMLGITKLENEIDYLTRLKRIGEEAIVIASKND
jgi:SAM-dependent methyltransferase